MEKFFRQLALQVKSINAEKFTADFIISTSDLDRHGDIVEQEWELGNYKRNPVVLNAHTYGDATEVIGKMIKIGTVFINQAQKQLEGTVQFAVEQNPKAKIIWQLVRDGFISAVSAGFIPKEFDDEGKILKSELLEVSLVAVPANQMALAKSKGIDIDKLTEKYEQKNDYDTSEQDEDNEQNEEGAGDNAEGQGNGSEDERGEGDEENERPAGNDADENAGTNGDENTGAEEGDGSGEIDNSEAIKEALEILEQLNNLNAAISKFKKVVTRGSEPVRAKTRRALHKTVRNLIKIRNKV